MAASASIRASRQSMRSDMFNNFTVIEFNVRDILIVESIVYTV